MATIDVFLGSTESSHGIRTHLDIEYLNKPTDAVINHLFTSDYVMDRGAQDFFMALEKEQRRLRIPGNKLIGEIFLAYFTKEKGLNVITQIPMDEPYPTNPLSDYHTDIQNELRIIIESPSIP